MPTPVSSSLPSPPAGHHLNIPNLIHLPPVTTAPPPRYFWQCPEVPHPEIEIHVASLMYEWMRTHRIALRHWEAKGSPENSPLTPQQHNREWEQYRAIAAYCQRRVFDLSGWPLPNPGLGFPSHRIYGTPMAVEIYSPRQTWTTPPFWETNDNAPRVSSSSSAHEPSTPPTRFRLFVR